MTDYKLCGEGPRWAHVKPTEPDTVYLGGDLHGMSFTMQFFPECITDPRLHGYDCIEDFIEDYVEATLSHEHVHIVLCHLEGDEVSTLWDNVDGLFQLTLNGEPF